MQQQVSNIVKPIGDMPADSRGYLGQFVYEDGLTIVPPRRVKVGNEWIVENGVLDIVFVIWNTLKLRDDYFKIQQTMLPRDTREMAIQNAKRQALSMIADSNAYEKQKIRLKGESRDSV